MRRVGPGLKPPGWFRARLKAALVGSPESFRHRGPEGRRGELQLNGDLSVSPDGTLSGRVARLEVVALGMGRPRLESQLSTAEHHRQIRLSAAALLADHADRSVVDALLHALKDAYVQVARTALGGLGAVYPAGEVPPPRVYDALLEVLSTTADLELGMIVDTEPDPKLKLRFKLRRAD